MGVTRALVALAGLTGASASEDMNVALRLLSSNSTNGTTNGTSAAPYKLEIAVETSFSVDIGNMTASSFVSQMAATTEWKTAATDSIFDMLKGSLSGLKKSEIQNVRAVWKARRLSGRMLAATAIKYDTKFDVVPDYSTATPTYMTALSSSTANSGMSVLDKLVNEVSKTVTEASTSTGGAASSFAAGALAAVKKAVSDNTAFQTALTSAGGTTAAVTALTPAAVTTAAPVVANAYTGATQTTAANYVAGAAAPAAATTSNAAAAGFAAVVASALMMF